MIRILWAQVCPAAAANWAAGDLSDGQLLLAPIRGRSSVFLLEMHGHAAAWRRLLEEPGPWAGVSVVFRSGQPGLARLGAAAGLEEPDGRRRYVLEGAVLEALRSRRNGLRQDTPGRPRGGIGRAGGREP